MFAKKLATLTQKYAEMYEHEIVFQEKRRFFAENKRHRQK
jgi:hypothetical protein